MVQRPIFLGCALAVLGCLCQGQPPPQAENHLECITDMELPQNAARGGFPKEADVDVTVTIGKDGKPDNISFSAVAEGPGKRLQGIVAYTLRERSTYDKACAGKRVRLLFIYRTEGKPKLTPFAVSRFVPPNRFIFVTQPQEAIIDRIVTPPNDEKPKPPGSGRP